MSDPPKPVLQKPPGFHDPTRPKPPPPRRPILPTTRRPKKKPRSGPACCCATCLLLLILILLASVAACLTYLILQPRVPVFHVQSIRFVRLNVTDGPDGAVMGSEAAVRVQIRNRNGVLRVNFGKTVVGLSGSGGSVDFGEGTFPGFSQPKMNTTVLKLTTKVKNMLLESGSGKKVRDGYKSKKLMMRTEVNTEVGVGAKGWNTIKIPIKAICEGVSLKDIESGSSVPKCKITLFKIFKIKTT